MEYKYKVIVLGDSNVGKTSILTRLVSNEFSDHHVTPIGISSYDQAFNVKGDKIKLQIWDTVGHERFRTVTSAYYNRTQGIILIYDCTNRQSMENITNWL